MFLALAAQRVAAQATDTANSVFAFGWSPAAGLLGIEWVGRSFSAVPRLGGAAGAGLAGLGARLNVALREPTTHQRVPYFGIGYAVTPWMPVVQLRSIASIEGGVQFWPDPPRHFYMDISAGVGFLSGASEKVRPVLRLLFGSTL